MQDDQSFGLAAGFGPVEEATWRAQVDRERKGAPFERLLTKTPEGIDIKPLYHAGNAAASAFPVSRRGEDAGREGYWEIRQPCDLPSPGEANAALLQDLWRGADGVLLEVSAPWRGRGVSLRDIGELDEALAGVWMDQAPLAVDAGAGGLCAAAARLALARRRGLPWAQLRGDLLLDPLAAAARGEAIPGGVTRMMARSAHVAAWCGANSPGLRALSVDVGPYDDAGASLRWSLAMAMSSGVAWLRALEGEGLPLSLVGSQLLFRLRIGPKFLMGIAALRAARAMWARITEASGLEAAPMRIEARLGWRALTRRDPWVNLLRVTAACFAGSVGGANIFVSDPMDAALDGVGELGRRMARNTQLVMQRETGLAGVLDPAGGSWAVETLTAELAEGAWETFQEIERGGGALEALRRGDVARAAEASWAARSRALARRVAPITGVSAFPDLREAALSVEAPSPAPARAVVAPEAARRAAVEAAASGSGEGLLEALIEAAGEGASLGLLSSALGAAEAWPGLPRRREAAGFEALRDRSDAALEGVGARPGVFLVCLGPRAEFGAREGFMRNLLEAGGLEALGGEPCDGPAAAAASLEASGARIAALCGSDERYVVEVEEFAAALRGAGAARVVLAGRPPEGAEARWRAAGVTDFVFLGVDALEALEALWGAVEEAR